MRHFRLLVAYDGTAFDGWQRQPGRRTVQGVLEEALAAFLERPIATHAAGRTDAGVHARGQVVSFGAETRLPVRALRPLLRARLPDDVVVRAAEETDAAFHARRSARARRYSYHLLREDDVLHRRYAWHPPGPARAEGIARALAVLVGEHDCSAFRSAGSTPSAPRCRILRASVGGWERGVRIDLIADHFLYRMVRNVVGTALAAARAADPAAAMCAVLASRDRARAGRTAPAHGLCLEQVFYTPPFPEATA